MEGKQILDVVLIPNETLNPKLKRFNGGDLGGGGGSFSSWTLKRRINDHVNWDFLLVVLDSVSFGQK